MKILLIGSGGREHALAWKLSQSKRVEEIFVAPGNAGTAELATNVNIPSTDVDALLDFALQKKIDLTLVGPEAPLLAGLVNRFNEKGLKVFGPVKEAAKLEGSKVFAKKLMQHNNIPTAAYRVFADPELAREYIEAYPFTSPLVIKADGLAAGKGVVLADTKEEALQAVEKIMLNKIFGQAGERIVMEEFLTGEEFTVLAFTDGETIIPMPPAQDHKALKDGDQGSNTGGMGAYAPAPQFKAELMTKVLTEILYPTLRALKKEGIIYQGVIYAGLMVNRQQLKVLEYNVRFGDPEAQVILPLLKTDLIDILEAIIQGKLAELEIEWFNYKALGVVMVSGGYPLVYETGKPIQGLEELAKMEDIIVFQAGTRKEKGKLLTAGGRVLTITALGDSLADSKAKAYQALKRINFEGAFYRRDIGNKARE